MNPILEPFIDQLIDGDCLEILQDLPTASIDFIILDFPISNVDYKTKYSDLQGSLEFANDVIKKSIRILKPNKSIILTAPWKISPYIYVLADEEGLHPQNDIVWYTARGAGQRRRFSYRHQSLYWFTKGRTKKDYFFNVDPVRIPYKYENSPNQNEKGANPGDVWPITHVCGRSRSRNYESSIIQLPEALICKLILSLTESEDIILDPMVGSGTTAVCAFHLNRRFIGIDNDSDALDFASQRLKQPFDGYDSVDVRSKRRPEYYNAKTRDWDRALVRSGIAFPELEFGLDEE